MACAYAAHVTGGVLYLCDFGVVVSTCNTWGYFRTALINV